MTKLGSISAVDRSLNIQQLGDPLDIITAPCGNTLSVTGSRLKMVIMSAKNEHATWMPRSAWNVIKMWINRIICICIGKSKDDFKSWFKLKLLSRLCNYFVYVFVKVKLIIIDSNWNFSQDFAFVITPLIIGNGPTLTNRAFDDFRIDGMKNKG